jgi:hypothetical protein
MVCHRRYSRRQLLANAAIAASRVASQPCVDSAEAARAARHHRHLVAPFHHVPSSKAGRHVGQLPFSQTVVLAPRRPKVVAGFSPPC